MLVVFDQRDSLIGPPLKNQFDENLWRFQFEAIFSLTLGKIAFTSSISSLKSSTDPWLFKWDEKNKLRDTFLFTVI